MALTVGLLVLGGQNPTARAELISSSSSFGPDTITMDTATGLQWLDVTLSTNLSYQQLLVQLGLGGTFEGYRLATTAEVTGLWENAGITDIFTNLNTSENFQPIIDLSGFVGVTNSGANQFTSGYRDNGAGEGDIIVLTIFVDPAAMTGRAAAGLIPEGADSASSFRGAWLVPEPSGLALLVLSLTALGLSRRARCGARS